MRRLTEQITGLPVYKKQLGKFTILHPVDQIKGMIISANTDSSTESLFPHLSQEDLTKIFEKSKNYSALNSKIIKHDTRFTGVYSAEVGSMSNQDINIHIPNIRNVRNPELVEHYCDCKKISKLRFKTDINFLPILDDWKLSYDRKYYADWTCPHICGLDFYLRKKLNVQSLGIEDMIEKGDFHKDYVKLLEKYPEYPDSVFNFVFTHYTPIYASAVDHINEIRSSYGLEESSYLSDPRIRNVIPKLNVSEVKLKEMASHIGF